ncbi:hypothetical protein B0T25DRAFT_546865 [Lasiosphaeria hispida]|uniref:Uncharacterized protein n=1 Tax=Lasiosphaeria hispida TaxID=260671 RepID=A0AAJ0MBU4_9PEZI|nr:hypothetical protein B0T25DRAFT_546865 [Lasiosphaeria hispida]
MHLHPFSFPIDISITLSAKINLPAVLVTIHLGPLELSANLIPFGPPVAGTASSICIDVRGHTIQT